MTKRTGGLGASSANAGAGVALALALGACSGAQGAQGYAGRPPGRVLPGDSVLFGRAPTVVVPALGAPRELAPGRDGARYLGVGGVRVLVRDGRAVAAPVGFAAPLRAASRFADGAWRFVTASGAVYRAAEFLATPTRELRLPSGVAAAAADGAGLAVQRDDGLLCALAAAPARAATSNAPAGATPAGLACVALVGAPAAEARAALRRAVEAASATPDELRAVALQVALEGAPAARLALESTVWLDGATVALAGEAEVQLARLSADGSLRVERRVALPEETHGARCALQAFGPRALWSCEVARLAGSDATLWRSWSVDGDGVEPWQGDVVGLPLASREGRTLARAGACAAATLDAEAGAAAARVARGCSRERDTPWRTWEYVREGRLLDVYEHLALFEEVREGASGLFLYAVHAARAHEVVLSDPSAEVLRAGFGPGGVVLVVAGGGRDDRRSGMVGVAAPGRPMLLRSVGFEARDVAMSDERRGLAVGRTADEVAVTTDGGVSWQRISPLLEGDAARVPLDETRADEPGASRGAGAGPGSVRRTGAVVQCGGAGCRAGRALVHLWGEGLGGEATRE